MKRENGNFAIDNFIIGKDAKDFRHVFIKDDVCPSCDINGKVIYSPVLPTLIDPEMDAVVRGKNEHEAGHARLTPGNKSANWSKAKGLLVNALEDLRIEKGIKKLSPAFVNDIEALNANALKEINARFTLQGPTCGDVNEAIFILMACANNFSVTWKVSDTANELVRLAKDDFAEWNTADCDTKAGFEIIEKITDKILAKWEAYFKAEDEAKENGGNDNSGSDDQSSENDNGEKSDTDNADNSGDTDGDDTNNADDAEKSEGKNSSDDGEKADDAEDGKGNSKGENDAENSQGNSSEDGTAENDDNGENANDNDNNSSGDDAGSKSSRLDDHTTEDSIENAIKAVIKKSVAESQEKFGDYKPYTAEDTVKKAVENADNFNRAKSEILGSFARFAASLQTSLLSVSKDRKICNRERGLLDFAALPAFAKGLNNRPFYNKKQGVSMNTTVSILIDESGSMGDYDKYLSARKVAIALAEALNGVSDIQFEILGHTTTYSNNCPDCSMYDRIDAMVIEEFKTFAERYSVVRHRLGSVYRYDCNVDSEALLYTFKRAMDCRTKRHIIIVLSDGMPSGAKSREVGGRHLRKVVDFVRKNGVEVYGFGILTEAPAQYYGKEYFVHLENTQSFATKFFPSVVKIIRDRKVK